MVKHTFKNIVAESAKLRAISALSAYMLKCQRALRAFLFTCQHALRALRAYVLTCYNYK